MAINSFQTHEQSNTRANARKCAAVPDAHTLDTRACSHFTVPFEGVKSLSPRPKTTTTSQPKFAIATKKKSNKQAN